jgi:hypothetical protein
MVLLGTFMVVIGTYYNSGFDVLGIITGVDYSASMLFYPWAFLFLVGGTLIVLVNSFFSFLKLVDGLEINFHRRPFHLNSYY